jgi:hypothetical protein
MPTNRQAPSDGMNLRSNAIFDGSVAVAFSVVGLFIIIVSLAISMQKVTAASEKSMLTARMKVYGDAERTLKLHKALSYHDDPNFVSRVLGSAREFEGQMRDL